MLHLGAATRSNKYDVTVSQAGDDSEAVANRLCNIDRSVPIWNWVSGAKIGKWEHSVDRQAGTHRTHPCECVQLKWQWNDCSQFDVCVAATFHLY